MSSLTPTRLVTSTRSPPTWRTRSAMMEKLATTGRRLCAAAGNVPKFSAESRPASSHATDFICTSSKAKDRLELGAMSFEVFKIECSRRTCRASGDLRGKSRDQRKAVIDIDEHGRAEK